MRSLSQPEVTQIDAFHGYRCPGGTERRGPGQDDQSWSGCDIKTRRDQAEECAGEAGASSGNAPLWDSRCSCAAAKEAPPMMVSITGDFQALILNGEDGDALVVPWAVLTDYISDKRIRRVYGRQTTRGHRHADALSR